MGSRIRQAQQSGIYLVCKRSLDILIAGAALVILAPVILLIALLVKLDSPGPIILKQDCIGYWKRSSQSSSRRTKWGPHGFKRYQFRTVQCDARPDVGNDSRQVASQDVDRSLGASKDEITSYRGPASDLRASGFGAVLRQRRLDGLPQLWNLLKGDMSLIGPPPATASEVEGYDTWHLERLMAKPGLIGLSQLGAIRGLDFDIAARMDIWYIKHQSLLMDLKILAQAPRVVLSRKVFHST